MLAKETIALPEIVDILGQRPYPIKASILEYLTELRERSVEEKALKEEEDALKKKKEEEAATAANA